MCLVSVLPKGTIKYNENVKNFIQAGFDSNTAGSGIMWKRNSENLVNIKKGFWNLEELLNFVENLKLTIDDELVVHHRVSTQGRTDDENCHPFIISKDHDICISLEGSFNLPMIAHNGIFHHLSRFDKNGYSDTYSFANGLVSKSSVLSMFREEPTLFKEVFNNVLGWSRIAILYPDRDVQIFGSFIEDDGYFHSNAGYKDNTYRDRGGVGTYDFTRKKVKTGGKETLKDTTIKSLPIGLARHSSLKLVEDSTILNDELNTNSIIDSKTKFTNKNIELTINNYVNFVYMLKYGVKIKHIDINMCYKATNFNEVDNMVNLYGPSNKDLQFTVSINELKQYFNYIPTFSFTAIYNDFILLEEKLNPSKTQIKRLTLQLKSKYNSEPQSRFIIKALGIFIAKGAVELWLKKHPVDFGKNSKKQKGKVVYLMDPEKGLIEQKIREGKAIDQELRELRFADTGFTD